MCWFCVCMYVCVFVTSCYLLFVICYLFVFVQELHQRSTELVEKLRKIGALEIGSDLSKALTACSESCKVIEEARMNMCKSVETHVLTPLHNMHALIKKQKVWIS